MSITCKVCGQEFKSLISASHLKKHNLSTKEYKSLHGKDSLASAEFRENRRLATSGENNPNFGNSWTEESRQRLRDIKKGSKAWNKGKKLSNTENQKRAALAREIAYSEGSKRRREYNSPSEETRAKIAKSVSEYGLREREEVRQRALKAIETKRSEGRDLAFFRGKTHSEENKELFGSLLRESNERKAAEALANAISRAAAIGLDVVSVDGPSLGLTCRICKSDFSFTRQYFTESKTFIEMCPVCHPRKFFRSSAEIAIGDYIKSLGIDITTNRRILGIGEIDIIADNTAIEYNGLYWHSESVLLSNNKSKTSDFEKHQKLKTIGFRPITIFEDEWHHNQQIVMSRLSHILGVTGERIHARACQIVNLSSKVSADFCEANHLQGKARSSVRLGLEHRGRLVSVMTFSRDNLSRKIKGWEVNRFCSTLHTSVVGGANKLFTHFVREYNPDSVISYADSRWSDGGLYRTLGMRQMGHTVPNYWYVFPNEVRRHHRFKFRTTPEETEAEIAARLKLTKVWDCGSSKWIWEK